MQKLETDDDRSSSEKYYVNCQELLNSTGNTKEWLSKLQLLDPKYLPPGKKARMSEKILMQGVLEKYKEVVIKLGIVDTIENEWNIYNKLKEHKVPGVLKYYCYFHCLDDFRNIPDQPEFICKGPGDNLKVILMDFGIHNLSDFPWKTTEALQSCIKQSMLTVLQAYLSFGLYHEDCHPRNFIIKQTRKTQREYKIDGKDVIVPLHGYETFMVDLEGSKINSPVKYLYTNLYYFCNKLDGQMIHKINSSNADEYVSKLKRMKDYIPTLNVSELVDIIENVSKSIILTQPNIEGGRYKLPWRSTKKKNK
jgi:hypothetical protein